jgi:cytochrome c2
MKAPAPLMLLSLLLASACQWDRGGTDSPPFTGGDPSNGKRLIAEVGCGACHEIPGVRGARGVVGPPLSGFARRSFVGGEVPNTTDNLIRWLQDPRSIEAKTAMPALGLSASQARDVAAFLYTLD